ncbi:cytidylyltransferase domain-containing protein [Hippea alviniae]|uniref:cytidylyltransferase domain-containing protein n=1 Tax=Hippea alviniae TaxID=1279027 RepID=UPI0003B7142B|nr:hypothetical protein [Hippea alviniae]
MVKNERVVAFIVARLSSSRLPKKHLKMIGDRRMIDWTIYFTKQIKHLDEIVIATTNEEENRELVGVAKEHNINIFLYDGDVDDVVGRLTKAAIEFDADVPVLVSGDCPLIWPDATNRRIEKISEDKELDYVGFCQKDGKYPIHSSVGVFRKKAWILADKLSNKSNLREHHFPIIGLKKDLFKIDCILCDDIFYKINHRISVDTLADLEFMNAVFNELKKRGKGFSLRDVVELLSEKPELMEINKDVHQIRIDERPKKALFIVESDESLNLFFDIAYDLTKKGMGVRFYSKHRNIKDSIISKGFGVIENIEKAKYDFVISDKKMNYECPDASGVRNL